MDEIRLIAGSGILGSGEVDEGALAEAMRANPHFIAADAGSTDAGPYALGTGRPAFPRDSIKRDLAVLLTAAHSARIPLIIGSAGTSGADCQVDWTLEIAREIAAEKAMRLRVAVIYSEQGKDYLKALLAAGRIRPLDPAPSLDAASIDRSIRIVGMMGIEPLQAALAQCVDLVIAGRCSDSALYAAMPIMRGFPAGLAWHAGKVMECGTLVCERAGKGVVLGRIRGDHATIRAVGQDLRCTPQSVAAHSLYENADPYLHKEASGTMDLTRCTFASEPDGSVRIAGSAFIPAETYSVKLEGAVLAGYQTIIVGGIRDPYIIRRLDTWLQEIRDRIDATVRSVLGDKLAKDDYRIVFHVYGRDAVMGALEPERHSVPHEIGLVMEATAPTQALATALAEFARQPLLHHPVPEWKGSITGFACLHNPAPIERGAVYRFMINHVALPDTPTAMFRTQFLTLN